MEHPEQIARLAALAAEMEARGADAAAILVDAAAMVAVDSEVDMSEMLDRLEQSHEMFAQARAAALEMIAASQGRKH